MYPDSKVHGANMGPTWVLSAPDGPHVGPMNLAIRVYIITGIPNLQSIPGQGNYEFYEERVSWQTARDVCMADGMDLIVVESQEVNDMIVGEWIKCHDMQ